MPKILKEKPVKIPVDKVILKGNLMIPKDAKGIVLFAHGSGSSRLSPRNRYVARVLQKAGLATLLMDLLTEKEETVDMITAEFRFDIKMLANRLSKATIWLKKNNKTKNLNLGYFGSSTGASAALIAAAKHPNDIKAVVSRGGRPDLSIPYLSKVRAPTLLIVGGDDVVVIEMNKKAIKHFQTVTKLKIVPGATHLFEEPGKLKEVARLATEWFKRYLISVKKNN